MDTKQETLRQEAPPPRPSPARPMAESSRPGVTVRVSLLTMGDDEEEKEAGYGHGV